MATTFGSFASFSIFSKSSSLKSSISFGEIPDVVYIKLYSFAMSNAFSEDSYFVNSYAQVAPEEDRASTFEFMMANTKASCLNANKPVWKKATIMSKNIDAALNTVSPNVTEYWERHL